MRSNRKAPGIVQRDGCESLKRSVFQKLNELAWSEDIVVIFRVTKENDPLTNPDYSYYRSIGPTVRPDLCLFCGWGHNTPFARLGEFVTDPWCQFDFVQQNDGVAILEREDHSPDVIIVTIWDRGSLDSAILDLAWGLAAHRLSSRRYSMSPARLDSEAYKQAAKLVRTLEAQLS